MKRITDSILLFLLVVLMISCSKGDGGGGGGNTPSQEASLALGMNPDPGNAIVPALSDSYAFKLLITSSPPKNGVKIDIAGTKDSDNSVAFSQTSQTNSNIASIDQQLTGLATGVLYNVKITVTSLTNSSNTASISFKIARK